MQYSLRAKVGPNAHAQGRATARVADPTGQFLHFPSQSLPIRSAALTCNIFAPDTIHQFIRSNETLKAKFFQIDERPKIVRVEYTDVTRASRELAWKVFTDFRRWRKFSDIYGDIRWSAGRPWKPGSRLRIGLLKPVKTTVDHVITVSRPAEFVAWIDHFLGNSMEQCVTFGSQPDGNTCVHTWAELTGFTHELDGKHLGELLKKFIEHWYNSFCAECNRLHEKEYAIW